MNDVPTFFRNPAVDPGETYQFQVHTENDVHRFYVCGRRQIDSKNFTDQQIRHKDLAVMRRDLENVIRTQGGGGMIVVVRGEGGTSLREVDVSAVGANTFSPAKSFVVLRPGYPPYSAPIERTAKINAGSHMLVPVDREAEEQLEKILGLLKWFSPDFEALILNAIRRPTLDVRLSNVETELRGKTADAVIQEENMKPVRRLRLRAGRMFRNPKLYGWSMAVLLVGLLGVNAWLIRRLDAKLPEREAAPAATQPASVASAAIVRHEGIPTRSTQLPFLTRQLLEELRKRRTSPNLQMLYEAHFSDVLRVPLTDDELSRLYERSAANRPFLLGLIKLEALKLEPSPADPSYLKKWDAITATKDVFRTSDRLAKDPGAQRFAAALSCRLGYSTPEEGAGLPITSNSAPFLFQRGRCDSFTVTDIETELVRLLDFVKRS